MNYPFNLQTAWNAVNLATCVNGQHSAYDWFLKTQVHHLLLYRLNWCLSTSTIKTEVRSRSRKPHGDRECLWSSRILDHGLIVVTDELGLPAEAWRVEPNTSWQRCWLAIQDGPLSRGNGGRVLKITVISNQRLFHQGQSERGNSNLALSYSPRQSYFALKQMNVERQMCPSKAVNLRFTNTSYLRKRTLEIPKHPKQAWFQFQIAWATQQQGFIL